MKTEAISKDNKVFSLEIHNKANDKRVQDRKNSPCQTWVIGSGYKLYTKYSAIKEVKRRLQLLVRDYELEMKEAKECENISLQGQLEASIIFEDMARKNLFKAKNMFIQILLAVVIFFLTLLHYSTFRESDYRPLAIKNISQVSSSLVSVNNVVYDIRGDVKASDATRCLLVTESNIYGFKRVFVELYK